MREHVITKDDDGIKMHKWLKKHFASLPLSAVFRSLRTKKVRLNGKHAKGEETLKEGDRVITYFETEQVPEPAAEKSPTAELQAYAKKMLPILYEDADIICIAKPAGMAVHPGTGTGRGRSLIELAAALYPDETPRLAHRIDKDTSGVIMIARHGKALRAVLDTLKSGGFEKRYLALVLGRVRPDHGTIELKLERHASGTKMTAGTGKNAVTRFWVKHRFKAATLIEAEPVTGRTHQIRAHFAALGHPLCGDQHYGDFAKNREFKQRYRLFRHFLHAVSLAFPHPATGERVVVRAELAEDLSAVLQKLEAEEQQK
jgi:23S rRNA pseudouridine955/2504/2580 synthase